MKIQLDEWTSTELPLADEKVIEQLLLLHRDTLVYHLALIPDPIVSDITLVA